MEYCCCLVKNNADERRVRDRVANLVTAEFMVITSEIISRSDTQIMMLVVVSSSSLFVAIWRFKSDLVIHHRS